MTKTTAMLLLAFVFLRISAAWAQDKVVVVPLGSASAKGTDGQLQYNDNGVTSGAELYYDKSKRRLEARGEVRTTDSAGNSRLWGSGRPGTGLIEHATLTGTCRNVTTGFALSKHLVTWGDVAESCPVGTWVCSRNDLPTSGACNIVPFMDYFRIECDGTYIYEQNSYLYGWLADAYQSSTSGMSLASHSFGSASGYQLCGRMRVWCCWRMVLAPLP